MQINRRLAKNKDIVYDVKDGDEVTFQGVVDAQSRVLFVVVPGKVTRAIERAIVKLVAKAKHRDGIHAEYELREGYSFVELDGESLISYNVDEDEAEPA